MGGIGESGKHPYAEFFRIWLLPSGRRWVCACEASGWRKGYARTTTTRGGTWRKQEERGRCVKDARTGGKNKEVGGITWLLNLLFIVCCTKLRSLTLTPVHGRMMRVNGPPSSSFYSRDGRISAQNAPTTTTTTTDTRQTHAGERPFFLFFLLAIEVAFWGTGKPSP